MVGEIVYEKPLIFQLRELNAGWMNKLTTGVKSFIDSHNFYPSVFYNENDINHPINGIRYAVPDLDNYSGVFVHQDAPDTPIAGFNGIEFRSSITKTIRIITKAKQLLWTVQDLTHLKPLTPSDYHETPSVQFCGTAVKRADGSVFTQQVQRFNALQALKESGLEHEINLKIQRFDSGKFILESGTYLSDEQYWKQMEVHPYGLSVRGWGNWDYRMYEMLASGRIPVHINTDDELLFENWIDWDEFIVVVNNPAKMKAAVEEFHSQFTDNKSLRHHQKQLIKLYHEFLSFPAFCKWFGEYYEDDFRKWGLE